MFRWRLANDSTRLLVIVKSSLRCKTLDVPCCICGSKEAEIVATGQDYEYETTADVFSVKLCASCGHHFLSPRPVSEELPVIYPPDYYAYSFIANLSPLARSLKYFLDSRKIARWLRDAPANTLKFLDVGCGEGWFLGMLHSRGLDKANLWGVEVDPIVVNKLEKDGFQARQGQIEEIADLPESYFDLIVSLQVIEHVGNPPAVLGRLARLLKPGGVLVLETPNIDSLDFRLFQNRYWGGFHFPRHWNFFTPKSLRAVLTPLGLEPVRIRYLPAPTFWLYSFHHVIKYKFELPRLARLVHPFVNLPLLGLAMAFDMFRAALGFKTSNVQMVSRKIGR
jgi:2-polyprenyl-3-methyl-5-hydroxy-6-metoxy-1,4-benzoquinol methylase